MGGRRARARRIDRESVHTVMGEDAEESMRRCWALLLAWLVLALGGFSLWLLDKGVGLRH